MTQLLVEAGLAAGLELKEQDYRAFQKSRPLCWSRDALNREHFERQPTVAAEALVAAFNAPRDDYVAEVQDGVIVIRPTGARAGYLDSYALAGRLTAVGLMRMGEKVFAPLNPRLDLPGGRVGSRIGRIGVEIDFGDALSLTVDTQIRNVREVLNTIVRQASARAWIVITTNDPTCFESRTMFVMSAWSNRFEAGSGTSPQIVRPVWRSSSKPTARASTTSRDGRRAIWTSISRLGVSAKRQRSAPGVVAAESMSSMPPTSVDRGGPRRSRSAARVSRSCVTPDCASVIMAS